MNKQIKINFKSGVDDFEIILTYDFDNTTQTKNLLILEKTKDFLGNEYYQESSQKIKYPVNEALIALIEQKGE